MKARITPAQYIATKNIHSIASSKTPRISLQLEYTQHGWQRRIGGDPIAWANASHPYAQEAFVPNGTMVSSKYYDVEIRIVDQQLALGGLRLAEVLNETFHTPPPAN